MARPITDTLRLLDEGAFLDRCSDLLAALVRGVEETGRPGKLQITLTLGAEHTDPVFVPYSGDQQ